MDEAELRAEIRKLTEAADKLASESGSTSSAFKDVGKAFGVSADKISAAAYGIKTIGTGVASFSRNLTSAELTFSKYATAVDQATSGLTGIFSGFGPLSTALKGLGDVTSALVGAVFKQNDAYLGAYDTLSKFGYAGTDVADSLFDITKGSGFVGARVNELVDVTTGLGNDLTFLGKTLCFVDAKSFASFLPIVFATLATSLLAGFLPFCAACTMPMNFCCFLLTAFSTI